MRNNLAIQPSLPGFCPLTEAVSAMAKAGAEERGAVFTRVEVVEFILDLAGYAASAPLYRSRLLEPSFGGGDFLLPAIKRLFASYARKRGSTNIQADLANAIRGIELHEETFVATRDAVVALLRELGLAARVSTSLADSWLVQDDFLLTELQGRFTHIVGNPPYIRQESIPQILIDEYRRRFATVYDRADIYVPFIERSLSSLSPQGTLAFICADRWMKNRYGGPLRELVANEFHLRAYVDMVDTPAFTSDVIAYPGIFVITRERSGPTRVTHRPDIEKRNLTGLATALTASKVSDSRITETDLADQGAAPWVLDNFEALGLVRALEKKFPTLEEAGCKVGIGVATGADQAYIDDFKTLAVEPSRKLPLVMTRDIASGSIEWRGFGVVNPFLDDGKLAPFKAFPKFGRYMEARREAIAGRHCAQKTPANWYRTIDRIYPDLVQKPKLLIPDIKGAAHIVYDEGKYYPHHNLYYIVSDSWDLRALQAVLLSGIGRLFVSAYSTKMRGGYLRFQAQYLRRIRVPLWSDVTPAMRKRLIAASQSRDQKKCNAAVAALYKLTDAESTLLSKAAT